MMPMHIEPIPVTETCVVAAARAERVPFAALIGLLRVEAGHLGEAVRNRDGSYDLGPMQINSRWLPKLRSIGISPAALAWNGCLNVRVGARILHLELNAHGGQPWPAIGAYHSHTPAYSRHYEWRVARALQRRESISATLARANRYRLPKAYDYVAAR